MHIIQIAPCYVDLEKETGGVSNIVRQITLYLAKNNHRVTVFCGNRELGKIKASSGTKRISDTLIQNVQYQRWHPLLGPKINFDFLSQSTGEPIIAHIHTCLSTFTESAMSKCIEFNIPYIFTPHGKLASITAARYKRIKRIYWESQALSLINQASKIAVSGCREIDCFLPLGIRGIPKTIPNGYEDKSSQYATRIKPVIDTPYVLFLGYLEKRKQPEFLIEVFARSRLRFTHKLIIAGPDAYGYQTSLKKLAYQLAIADCVIFYGPAYKKEKESLLKYATCFCLPSKAEGLPVVLCEAMGAGIPVLYSAACNFPELTQKGCGLEITGFDIQIWMVALERICLDEKVNQKMRDCALKINARYTWTSICQEWVHLYETCCSDKGKV